MALEALLEESIALKRVGVLGYGATARSILAEFYDNDAYPFVWGRDEEKAQPTCARFDAQPWPAESTGNRDQYAAAESAFRARYARCEPMRAPDSSMDANYGTRSTLHHQLEREIVTGDAMLEEQARASFDFWLAHLEGVAPEKRITIAICPFPWTFSRRLRSATRSSAMP